MVEKAYVLEGTATLTATDEAKHGPPIDIGPKDMASQAIQTQHEFQGRL